MSAEEKVNVYGGPYHWYLPPFFDFLHRAPLALFEEYVAPDARVLDVGSGDARLTHFLAKRFRRVIGIEPPTNWDGVPIKAAFPTLIRSTSP